MENIKSITHTFILKVEGKGRGDDSFQHQRQRTNQSQNDFFSQVFELGVKDMVFPVGTAHGPSHRPTHTSLPSSKPSSKPPEPEPSPYSSESSWIVAGWDLTYDSESVLALYEVLPEYLLLVPWGELEPRSPAGGRVHHDCFPPGTLPDALEIAYQWLWGQVDRLWLSSWDFLALQFTQHVRNRNKKDPGDALKRRRRTALA